MANDAACGWEVTPCDGCCDETIEALTPEMWALMQTWAVDFLWRATGKNYGLCENTYRPCRRNCGGSFGWPLGAPWIPWRINDQWVNLSCSTCLGECGCGSPVSEIRLPQVDAVTGIRVDGVDLVPEDTVAVYDRNRIVRIDGEQWPGCQNLANKDGMGTWSVTVSQGLPVPAGGGIIAGMLACEFGKACVGDEGCRLPRQVQTLNRQGITMNFQPQFDNLPELLTGIFEVDQWILSARTTRFGAPSITSPDRPAPARMTWPVAEPVAP